MAAVFMEYDETYVAGHKASSITSIESGDHPPSLYSGHANSCSSLCDPDELPVFEDAQSSEPMSFFKQYGGSISIPLATDDDDPMSLFYHHQANPSSSFTIPVITDNQEAPIPHDDGSSTFESKRSSSTGTCLLSQDERRVNHIASEQKRRQNIRTGFQQLTDLIPALKNVPHRKSTILFKTADYIKHTEKRNKVLHDRLKSLQRRLSPSSPVSSSSSTIITPSSIQLVQIRRLQKQLLRQQELLQQHNIPHHPYRETKAIIMPASDDDDQDDEEEIPHQQHHFMTSTPPTPCLNIPADEEFGQESMLRERLLSCGKLKLKRSSSLSLV
ncbi:unnamed protein product [Absidia cylindrospora]